MKNLIGAGLATIAILAAAAFLIWLDAPVADRGPNSTPRSATPPVPEPPPHHELPPALIEPDIAGDFVDNIQPAQSELQLTTPIEPVRFSEPFLDTTLLDPSGENTPVRDQLDDNERRTLVQTSPSDTSLRNPNFPSTYISKIQVELISPNHWVHLTWTGPQAAAQPTGPFRSSPGRGLGNNNCDDVAESQRNGSNCTPKGSLHVTGFSETMRTCNVCRFITWFQSQRGIAFHYYPDVPDYPASHGCVRLERMHAAQLIHNNSKIGATEVTVDGKWEFVR
jgi:hypothetical protein